MGGRCKLYETEFSTAADRTQMKARNKCASEHALLSSAWALDVAHGAASCGCGGGGGRPSSTPVGGGGGCCGCGCCSSPCDFLSNLPEANRVVLNSSSSLFPRATSTLKRVVGAG